MQLSKRQLEIIDAATELIGDKGIQNLTTKKLAAKMGFTEPALYRHFKGKSEILESLLHFYSEKLGNGLEQINSMNISSLEKIQEMMKFQFNNFASSPAIIMVIFAETSFQNDSELSKYVSLILAKKRHLVGVIVSSGQTQNEIRDDISADQLTTMLMGSMRFTILRWRLGGFSFDLLEEGETLFNTMKLLLKK
jgi:AcrR family transcriptional regulator